MTGRHCATVNREIQQRQQRQPANFSLINRAQRQNVMDRFEKGFDLV